MGFRGWANKGWIGLGDRWPRLGGWSRSPLSPW